MCIGFLQLKQIKYFRMFDVLMVWQKFIYNLTFILDDVLSNMHRKFPRKI